MSSGAQLEEARIQEKLAALPLLIRDPVRARLEESHDDAHQQLQREAARLEANLSPLRARNRLRKMKALMRMLDRTDAHCTSPSDVPCREERERLIGPVIAELEKVARQTRSVRRERKPIPITKEANPMPTDPYHRPGQVTEEPAEETARREQADAARRAAAEVRGIPEMIQRYVTNFDGAWASSQPDAVREHRTRELIRAILAGPARDHVPLLTWLVDRQTRRGICRRIDMSKFGHPSL